MRRKHNIRHCIKVAPSAELYDALQKAAEEEAVSLNQLIVYLLAKEVAVPSKRRAREARTSTEGFDELFEVKHDAVSDRLDNKSSRRKA